ncbi:MULTISPECIES: hypothetical protein [unclassified Streptomyces]|uniref:hypothetical protein n=1 Tax=unclassified Streptomyces TaxID=2593676 RepID=UPI00214CF695|nr:MULTISPECIES: hypothetical protein [unclassified Streptomyces]MCX5610216.1 hypothetical protein [Streptomyces sp. NBC_00047]UUU44080.1 hypothetical protein JIW86_38005 [Streptomyces sp. NBC_00162]
MANPASPALTQEALVELAERVERLCREHGRGGQLVALLEEEGAENLLDEAVALATSADYAPTRMRQVLDAIEQALAAQGVHGLTRPDRAFSALPGVQGARRTPSAHVCPLSRCTRGEADQGRCALADQPLEAVPLDGSGPGRP